jgi:hypothetical protein
MFTALRTLFLVKKINIFFDKTISRSLNGLLYTLNLFHKINYASHLLIYLSSVKAI